MLTIDPKEVSTSVLHSYLLGAVAPRPIAFASTIDKEGRPNLAPFSFFNIFSANPPIAIFSPARSGRTGSTKNTYENIKEVPEVVINVVNYDMVQQMSLASTEYPKGTNEFIKAGFTQVESKMIKPYRVKESPAQLECIVKQVIELGDKGGAGNLIICEVVLMHINENILDDNKQIDPKKIDLVARMGGNWYSRSNGDALFEVAKPLQNLGIGIDMIPDYIRKSNVLSGNNLGQLGNIEKIPSEKDVMKYKNSGAINEAFEMYGKNLNHLEDHLHHIAKGLLENNKVEEAWKVLLSFHH
ncbi:MAG: flavin reductase family protein [Bacteroidetes bacterium]|nr:flavin reductase family protein [Bacteroidota bacterium]